MATYTSNTYDGRYLQLSISETVNVAANSSTLNWTLTSAGGSSSYYTIDATDVIINGTSVYSKERTNLRKLIQHIRHLALTEDTAAISADISVLSVVKPVALCQRCCARIQAHGIHEQSHMVTVLRNARKLRTLCRSAGKELQCRAAF